MSKYMLMLFWAVLGLLGWVVVLAPIWLLVLLTSCATTSRYAYEELDSCPARMTPEQRLSGVVRCRAMCSSYARDFAEFTDECGCFCAPAPGQGGYRPQARKAPITDRM